MTRQHSRPDEVKIEETTSVDAMLHHIEDIFSHPPQPTAAGDEDTDDASHE
jgi:hypothetical protein